MDVTTLTVAVLIAVVSGLAGVLIGLRLGWTWSSRLAASSPGPAAAASAGEAAGRVHEGLQRLHDQLRDMEHARSSWQGQLNQQVLDMRLSTESLRRETQSLTTALRKPQVRGHWGELHLRRAVELAGMVEHCDFTEQHQLARGADESRQRPDLVVRLAGGRQLVVDAKVPLDAFLDATSTDDDEDARAALTRHAEQVRRHVDGLSGKRYWRALGRSPEFVVLFMPSDSFLAAALGADHRLVEYAAARHVVLASPTTLIALLRTVAHGWRHEALSDQADEIHRLGRELHERLTRMSQHVDNLGRSLNAAVGHYNQAVGAFESRVLVSARRFTDLGVVDSSAAGQELSAPRQIDAAARSLGDPPLPGHSNRDGSPAPRRSTTGDSSDQSMTVVG
ncbi:MAG: DNA recombination protein RmuC [Nocardioides sp.]